MLSKFYSWYGRKAVWSVMGVIAVLLVAGLIFKLSNGVEEPQSEVFPVVEVATVAELGGASSLTLLGTVKSVSEANIETEAAGRVTSVPVSLGATISAGSVIATLENASERAAVLQAEGAYEATLASASVGDISVDQAQTAVQSAKDTAKNSLQGAYTTVNNTFFTVIDDLYNNPTSPLPTPLITDDNRSFLASERAAFRTILPEWQNNVTTLNDSGISAEINNSIANSQRTLVLVDSFLGTLRKKETETLNGVAVETIIDGLIGARTSLTNSIAALEAAQSSLRSAEDSLEQARLGGTNENNSVANAQIKQALGALRAAQANLAKTIVTSPIAGTVNSLNVSVGDFVGAMAPVAKVANNNALEVTVFVGDSDREAITVGSPVTIDGKYPGVVTHIGAGIDAVTQKTEVKVATETTELTNGATVSVALQTTATDEAETTTIMLPITAVKFSAENGSVLTVVDEHIVEHAVEVGQVRGSQVEIINGVTPNMAIIVDTRGLTSGAKVEVKQ